MAVGSLHTLALAIVAALAAVAVGLLWYDGEPLRARPAATTLVALGVVLVGWTALQAVPLPRAVVAALAPENADVWARALSPLREEGPAWITLSLDPIATRVQVLRGVTYLLFFVGAVRVAYTSEGVAFLERALVAAGIAMAAAALLHPVFGAQRVFGAYEPGEKYAYSPQHIAPLLNTNHLAGYVNIGLLVALGASVRRSGSVPRPLAAAAAVVLVATNFWSASRGGTATMLLGAVLVVGLTLVVRRSDRARTAAAIAPVVLLVAAGSMMFVAGVDEAKVVFTKSDMSKLGLFRNVLDLIPRFAVFGLGRGAFESVFPSVRTGSGYLVWTHPENLVLQWATEWGAPIALLALGAVVWSLRAQTALARSKPPVGAWAALAAVGLHNLVDFNAEVPGVVVALATCAAIVTGGSGGGRARSSRVESWSARPDALVAVGGAAVVVASAVALAGRGHELYDEQRAFADMAAQRSLDKEAWHPRLRAAMLRHPAEPYFPFVGAVRASAAQDEPVLPWAARALERSPVYGRAHLLLARSLWRRNPSQARLEYRLAVEQDELLSSSLKEALPLVRGFDDAMELVPSGKSANAALEALAVELAPRLPSTAYRLEHELARRDPTALAPHRRAAAAVLADLRNHEPWCEAAPERCLDEGLAAAAKLRDAQPDKCEGHERIAELRLAAGEPGRALDDLERAVETAADRTACARRLVTLSTEAGEPRRAEAAIARLTRMGCGSADECADNLVFAASAEQGRGNQRRALALYRSASERAPHRDDLLANVASLADAQGLHGEALEAYTKLAQRHPEDPKWTQAADAARAKLRGGLAPRVP